VEQAAADPINPLAPTKGAEEVTQQLPLAIQDEPELEPQQPDSEPQAVTPEPETEAEVVNPEKTKEEPATEPPVEGLFGDS